MFEEDSSTRYFVYLLHNLVFPLAFQNNLLEVHSFYQF